MFEWLCEWVGRFVLGWLCHLVRVLSHGLGLRRTRGETLVFRNLQDGIYCGILASVAFRTSVLGPVTQKSEVILEQQMQPL